MDNRHVFSGMRKENWVLYRLYISPRKYYTVCSSIVQMSARAKTGMEKRSIFQTFSLGDRGFFRLGKVRSGVWVFSGAAQMPFFFAGWEILGQASCARGKLSFIFFLLFSGVTFGDENWVKCFFFPLKMVCYFWRE